MGYLFYHCYAYICHMEGGRIFKKILIGTHFPTWMLIIGYITYWLELYLFKRTSGQTTCLATVIFVLCCVFCLSRNQENFDFGFKKIWPEIKNGGSFSAWILGCGWIFVFLIFCISFYAALLPPHLIQETDALNYHLTLPRQHLILNSFQFIPWSSADLFVLPIDFALAPFWLVTALPNKFPQFLFLLGMIGVALSLSRHLKIHEPLKLALIVFSVLGSQCFGIQMGTAMLDIVLCYLFLASLDSFLKGAIILSAIEFTFFFWSKPFVPLQMGFIFFVLLVLFFIMRKLGFKQIQLGFCEYFPLNWIKEKSYLLRKFFITFVVSSIIIAGPFLLKSLCSVGTPLYPFMPGKFMVHKNIDPSSVAWKSIIRASESYLGVKDGYGYGRSLKDFINHFWLVAVPDKDVNNQFDYPLGLPYLIFLGPFIVFLFHSLKAKEFAVIPWFVVSYWMLWWFGSQQARFLYIPLVLMYIVVISKIKPSNVLITVMVLALLLNFVSVVRANRHDFGLSYRKILREKDLELVNYSQGYLKNNQQGSVDLTFGDVAFAQFPVNVTEEKMPFIISY